ncbi:MAG: glycosyltransferase [Oscillospiraceae bacterium]|nr:glycosyltransferase [Oscillospiraceae bacterium]
MSEFLRDFVSVANYFFLLYVVCYAVLLFFAAIYGSVVSDRRMKLKEYQATLSLQDMTNYFPISILVPAHNEELTILDAVSSLTKLDYSEYEVIVIDDGSTDATAEVLIEALDLKRTNRPVRLQTSCLPIKALYESEGQKPHIMLAIKENGGKADALNMGVNLSSYPYFLTMDADSILQKDALQKIIMPVIEDSRVIAVGGSVQVANETLIRDGVIEEHRFPSKPLVLLQLLDYSRTFMGMRLLLDAFNGNMIISGACGLFRKDLVIQVGGYNTNIVGEDMELVVKLHAFCRRGHIPYRIVYASDAVCWTQVPSTLSDLKTQRRRWHMGLFQSLGIHKEALFNPTYGSMGLLSMVYYLLLEAVEPVIELLGLTVILLAAYLQMLNIPFMIWYFFLFFLLSTLVTITSFFMRNYTLSVQLTVWQAIKVILFSFIESLGFHQLLSVYRMSAFVNYRRDRHHWGTIKRDTHTRDKEKNTG